MSLLFWYLPFMIMSGAYDTFYQSDHHDDGRADASRVVKPQSIGESGPKTRVFTLNS
jgi:hypothetical protein